VLTFCEPPLWPQHVRALGEEILVIGRWHFLVRSKSDPDGWHAVDLESVEDAEGQHCTCESGQARKACRHERAVRAAFGLLDNADTL